MSKPLVGGWIRALLPVVFALAAAGCSGDDTGKPPLDGGRLDGPTIGQEASSPDSAPLTAFKIAAVQYGKDKYGSVKPGCTTDVCAMVYLGKEASKAGANLALFPEYAVYQPTWDQPPAVGDMPATDPKYASTLVIKPFAQLAVEEKMFVVFNLKTEDKTSGNKYNTNIAVDPSGKVVAVHHKYELYSQFEKDTFTPGTSIEESFFDTPAGKTGMLICSDIHCVITSLTTTAECTTTGVDRVQAFAAKKPALVLVSNYWFSAADLPVWGSIVVGATLAKSMQAYVATSNTTKGSGYGGAIYDPQGTILAKEVSTTASVVYAEIPLAK